VAKKKTTNSFVCSPTYRTATTTTSTVEDAMTDTQSVQSEDIYFDYAPSFECMLGDDENGEEPWIEPPPMMTDPPPSSKKRSFLRRNNTTNNNNTNINVKDDLHPPDNSEMVIIDTSCDTIEVRTVDSWQNWKEDRNYNHKQYNSRKMALLAIGCLLVIVTALALGLGLQKNALNEETTSDFAAANDGTNNNDNSTDSSTPPGEPSEDVSPTPAPMASTPAPVGVTVSEPPITSPNLPEESTSGPTSSPVEEDVSPAPVPMASTPAPVGVTVSEPPIPSPNLPEESTSGPTSKPVDEDPTTDAPTSTPSSESSSVPPEDVCTNLVQADKTCYLRRSMINIAFENCEPLVDDWMGIYRDDPDNLDLNNLGNSLMWLWTCGSINCQGVVFDDTLPFGGGLPEGTYVAHLIHRNSGGPYSSYAASEPFEISTDCA
jgi:hypothetical protein